jgi:PAS domain S-box-containing protein
MEEKLKILAIVPTTDKLRILKAQLESVFPGSEIYAEPDRKNGLSIASAENPDVMLLYLSVQENGNIPFCQQIKANPKLHAISVIFLVSKDISTAERRKALEAGADSFLSAEADEIELFTQIKAMAKIKAANEIRKDLQPNGKNYHSSKEDRYRILSERTSDFTFSCQKKNGTFEIDWMSGDIERVLGYTIEEVLEKKCWRFIVHPEDDSVFEKSVISLKAGEESRCELRIVKPSGEINWITVNAICAEDTEKDTLAIYGGCVDITERKSIETALQVKDWAIKSAITAIVTAEMDGTLNYANPAFIKMWGYDDASEIIGRNAIEFWELGDLAKEVQKTVQEKGSWSGELTGMRKDGSTFIAQVSTNKVLDNSGNAVCMQASFSDITEIKKTEEQSKTSDRIFNHSIDMICIAGFDGYFKVLNPAWSKILGWSKEEMLTRPWNDFVHPDDLLATNAIKSVILDGQEIYQFENRYRCKDGNYKWLSWNSFPYAEEGIMYGVARDVTSQRQTEREYQTLFNEMLDGFALHEMIYDKDGKAMDYRFLNINPAYEAMTGLQAKDILGKTLLEVLPETEKYWIETYAKVVETGEPVHFENFAKEIGKYYEVKAFSPAPGQFVTIVSDITDRKTSEEAFKESVEFIKAVMDNLPIGLAVNSVDPSIRFEYMNDKFAAIYGTTKEALENAESFWEAVYEDPVYREEIKTKVIEDINSGKPERLHWEDILIKRNGQKTRYVWAQNTPIPNKSLMISTVWDVTERKNAEINLRNSEEKFRSIIDSLPLAIHLSTEAEQITEYINPTMEKMFGYTQEEIPSVAQWWPLAYPDKEYREHVSEEWNKRVVRALQTQTSIEPMEVVCSCKDGSTKNILWSYIANSGLNYSLGLDITEQKQAEKELQESEERFRALHNASFGGISIHDQGTILACNKGLSEMTGYSIEELIGMNGLNLISAEAVENVINNIKSGYEKAYESVCVRKDQTTFPIRIESRNIPFKGKMVRVTEFRDITEQKRYEKELRESEERFRLLVKNSSDVIVMVNEKGIHQYLSQAIETITGYPADTLLGKSILEAVHPDDIAMSKEVWEKIIKNPDQTVTLQYRHKHKTKEWIYLEAIGQSFLETPGINAVIASVRDISDRKQTEKIEQVKYSIARSILNAENFIHLLEIIRSELGLMFDTTNFFVAMYDAERDMLINTINKDEKEYFEEWPAKESLSGYVVKSGASVLMKRKEIKEFSVLNNIQLIGVPASCWMGVPIKVENAVAGVMAIQSYQDTEAFNKADLTLLEMIAQEVGIFIERQKNIERLVKAKEKAEESDKLKSAFINNISHEIRTPLNGIMGFGQLIAEEDLSAEEKSEYLKTLQHSSNRLMNTVTDFMDMALIASGSLKQNNENILLGSFLNEVIQKMKPYSERKSLELELVKDSDAAKTIIINSDKELLEKVLLKLIDNAIKFTDTGKVSIGYHILKNKLEFYVHDTGRGIAEDKLKQIFDMFSQEETALTRGYEGSGLGLSIASGIVIMLKGELKVRSKKGKGSVFSFTIPYVSEEEKEVATPEATDRITGSSRPVILVAEDEETNYMLMEVIVKKTGSEYLHALNGEIAVEICRHRPDITLVLMDIKMPVMNGIEAAKHIRKFRPDLPIIATTAFAQIGDESRILQSGFDGYYAKPIKPNILKDLIQKYG